MKIYIWSSVEHLTDNYHQRGGVAIVAPTLELARCMLLNPNAKPCEAMSKEPDAIYDLEGDPVPRMYVFPDAGCC